MRFIQYFLFILCLMNLSLAHAEEQTKPRDTSTTLSISAEAKIKATPDIATISAGIITEAFNAHDALRDNSVKMENVFNALKDAGINKKDIQTSTINIYPQYTYIQNHPPKIKGYNVNNTIRVTLKNIEYIGSTLDALVSQGVNNLNGPVFSMDNPEFLLDEARKKAIAKAQNRAKLYAEATGLKIKRIVAISENYNQFFTMPRHGMMMEKQDAMFMAGAAPSTPVEAGELELSVTVNMNYELAQN